MRAHLAQLGAHHLAPALPGRRGEQLPQLLREHGYESLSLPPGATVVDVGCGTGRAAAARQAGAISDDEAEAWIAGQSRRAAEDRLLLAIPLFLASATR
jgi:SAM-dependent methyltransferase